jgi:EAL domain-containing protein (putative c-di-GMP-specific phosphodiesterase class I)/CheY-like chemotaxis protein
VRGQRDNGDGRVTNRYVNRSLGPYETPGQRFDFRLRHLDDIEQTQRQNASIRRMEGEMHAGLTKQQFRLHYQPIVSLPNSNIVCVEALLRWQHPGRGLVSPLDFIPIAEDSDLILELGEWVVTEACRQVGIWQRYAPGLRSLRVAVNLSVRQLNDSLLDVVTRALAMSGLPAESLELEVTESVAMADIEGALEILHTLASLGVGLIIDDFGTGYSSLAYIKQLPVTGLKIDKSFIDDLVSDQRDASIVGAVIALAATLGLNQIAEGVETASQRRKLEALGCAHAQGYLFSAPRPPESFIGDIGHLIGPAPEPSANPVRVVVCDETSVRKLYRRALGRRDVEVFDAETAEQCLAQVSSIEPDLVILDANLNGRSGIDTVEDIHALRPNARVVVVSGTVTNEMRAASQAAGANACMQRTQFLPRLAGMVDSCRR